MVSLRDREVACSASAHEGLSFKFCVWRAVSSRSSDLPQKVLLAQFSLHVHKCGLKPHSFNFAVVRTAHRTDGMQGQYFANCKTLLIRIKGSGHGMKTAWLTILILHPSTFMSLLIWAFCNRRNETKRN